MLTAMDDFESLFPKFPSIAKFTVEIKCAIPYKRPKAHLTENDVLSIGQTPTSP